MTSSAPDREPPARVEDEAMERAVREHAALVYRVARAVLRDHHDAEDAAQDVFLRVLRLRRGLDGVANTRTWFARIAFRVALDRRRRPGLLSLDDAGADALRSDEAAADDVAAARQVRALVASKVADLPGDLRHAVRLSTVAELSSPEIAALLGIPEGTVRTRLMRARRILRVALAAAMGLVLAAAGILLLRKRETGENVAEWAPSPRGDGPARPKWKFPRRVKRPPPERLPRLLTRPRKTPRRSSRRPPPLTLLRRSPYSPLGKSPYSPLPSP